MVLREQLSPEQIAIAECNARRYCPNDGMKVPEIYVSGIEKQSAQSIVSKRPIEVLV